jgi:MFS family permease
MQVATYPPRRLSVSENIALSFFWFTNNVQWTALIIIVMPAVIRGFVGNVHSGEMLSLVSAIGALIASVSQPVFGAISDRSLHRWGRRRPFMLAGVVLTSLTLVLMGMARSLWLFAGAFFVLEVVTNLATAPYAGLIPDIVVQEQRGTASGYMGLMNEAAIIFGVLLPSYLSIRTAFEVLAALQIVGLLVTLYGVRERPLTDRPPFSLGAFLKSFWLSPRAYPDWWWVFGTRLLVLLGFATLEYYLYYYLLYVQHLANPNGYLDQILLLVTGGSVLSVLAAGWLSDKLHRRRFLVTLGGLLMGLTAIGFVFTHQMGDILALAAVFGLGYGTYISCDWALAVDVLPPTDNAAKDMGLWSISQTLSQTIATVLGGLLLVVLARHFGLSGSYRGLYLLSFIYFLLGSVLIFRVRSAR